MFHYKDEKPVQTVNRIRGILADMGIMPTELWQNSVKDIYSVRLTIPKVKDGIGVNGKGVSKELALASAYGELIERIQNQILFPVFDYYDYDNDLKNYMSFAYDPEERVMKEDDIRNEFPTDIIDRITEDREIFHNTYGEADTDESICLPYYSLAHEQVIYLPVKTFFYYYGSNGMSAGNTPAEALVQGICEIMERHVMKEFLHKKTTPPDIPADIIRAFYPKEARMIENIEKTGQFRIIVKDCTLGEGFPVIGIIVYNRKNGKYFVKFGSHPDLRIALERSLTELLQGRDISKSGEMMEYHLFYDNEIVDNDNNYYSIFRNGRGFYPKEFFRRKPAYEIDRESLERKFDDNDSCLQYLLGIIESKGWNLLIRNVGFLGIPAFSIIIPGISELNLVNQDSIEKLKAFRNLRSQLRNIGNLDSQSVADLLSVLQFREKKGKKNNFVTLTGISLDESHGLNKVDFHLLSAILHRKLGDIKNTYISINDYLSANGHALSDRMKTYFKCARNYLSLLDMTDDHEEIREILGFTYEHDIMGKVIRDFSTADYLMSDIGTFNCPDCGECGYAESCFYGELRAIQKRLKEKMSRNPIDQTFIRDYLTLAVH